MKYKQLIYCCFYLFHSLFINSCKTSKTNQLTDTILIENKGIGGNTSIDILNRLEADVLEEHPDLVILMVGTNDMLNSRKMISYQEYSSNLNKIVKTIKDHKVQVLLMSSPPADSIYLFERHDPKRYQEAPNVKMDSASQIAEQIAIKNKVLFLNIYRKFNSRNIPRHNEDLYIRNEKNSGVKDGVHPTALGYKIIAEDIYHYLVNNNLDNKYAKIICLGDSITKGSGVKGAGTVRGENYPTFLFNMLLNKSIN